MFCILNLDDLVGYPCLSRVLFDRQDHGYCSLSVEDASHALCAFHDA